jgi:hypothetical protein
MPIINPDTIPVLVTMLGCGWGVWKLHQREQEKRERIRESDRVDTETSGAWAATKKEARKLAFDTIFAVWGSGWELRLNTPDGPEYYS